MSVKLKRLQTSPYAVTYIQGNGNPITYNWRGATAHSESIVEVDDVVYDWLKYNTVCFQKKKLVVVDEDRKEELNQILTEEELEAPVYDLESITKLLEGNAKSLKAVVDTLTEAQLEEFVSVAKQIGLDSASKRAILAKKLKMPVEIIFGEE